MASARNPVTWFSQKNCASTCAGAITDLVHDFQSFLRPSKTVGPVLVDVRVTREENTYPMIPAGQPARNMVG